MAISKINTNSIAAGASPTMDDLTLTGSLFLGGTGSANELDDYEEGTWTPTDVSGAGLTFSNTSGNCFYTKIGDMVYASFTLTYPSTASGSNAQVSGLPFTVKTTVNGLFPVAISEHSAAADMTSVLGRGSADFFFLTCDGSVTVRTNANMSGKNVRGVAIYKQD